MGQQDSGNGAGMAALMVFYGLTISTRVEHIRFSQDHNWSCQAKTYNEYREKHASLAAWELSDAACEWACTDKWQADREREREKEKGLSYCINVYCEFEGELI